MSGKFDLIIILLLLDKLACRYYDFLKTKLKQEISSKYKVGSTVKNTQMIKH